VNYKLRRYGGPNTQRLVRLQPGPWLYWYDSFTYRATSGAQTSEVAAVVITRRSEFPHCRASLPVGLENPSPPPNATPGPDSLLVFGSGMAAFGVDALARLRVASAQAWMPLLTWQTKQ